MFPIGLPELLRSAEKTDGESYKVHSSGAPSFLELQCFLAGRKSDVWTELLADA